MTEYKRGRYRTDKITIKEIGNLQIIFWDKETIYLIDIKRGLRYIFHRWFAPRASYSDWNAFRSSLWSSKHTQIGWYFEQAATWEICFTTSRREVDLEGKEIRYL